MGSKMKIVIGFLCVFSFLISGIMLAENEGSDKKGKYYFKKTCKPCHTADAEGGEVTPLVKTMAQWDRYFEKGVHKNKEEKLEDAAPADQLIHIQTFLVNHAADSDQPETCG